MPKFIKIMLFTALFGLLAQNTIAQTDTDDSGEPKVSDNRVSGTQSFSKWEFFPTDLVTSEGKYYIVSAKRTDSVVGGGVKITSFQCYASESQKKLMKNYNGICYITTDSIYYDSDKKCFKEIAKTKIPLLKQQIADLKTKKQNRRRKKELKFLEDELLNLYQSVIVVITSWGDQLDQNGNAIRSGNQNGTGGNGNTNTTTNTNTSSTTSGNGSGNGNVTPPAKPKPVIPGSSVTLGIE